MFIPQNISLCLITAEQKTRTSPMNKIKFMYSAYSQFKCFTFCYIHSVLHVSTKRDEYVEKDTNLEEFHTNTVTLMKAQ